MMDKRGGTVLEIIMLILILFLLYKLGYLQSGWELLKTWGHNIWGMKAPGVKT